MTEAIVKSAHLEIDIKSIPFRFLTDRSLRLVRNFILVAVLLTIAVSQNMSYYRGSTALLSNGIYYLSMLTAVAYIAVAYLHVYILAPRFLAKRDYAAYFILSIAVVAALGGVRLWQNSIVEYLWGVDIRPAGFTYFLDSLSDLALNMLCFTGVSFTVLLKYWMGEEGRIAELEMRELAVEVESFRSSVDADMLLNTIHKCGVHSISDPYGSSEMILKLSELLRYQLYESGKDKVFLSSEISFIRNYLELEKKRTGDLLYSVSDEGSTMVYVSPFVFMPVIKKALENRKPDQQLNVAFSVERAYISFRCNCMAGIDNGQIRNALKRISAKYGSQMECKVGTNDEIFITIANEKGKPVYIGSFNIL